MKNWGSIDGLSDRQVNYICKDPYGFIWLCTRSGLNRFDGYNFKVYNADKNHLPFDNLSKMVLDNNGQFWVMGSEFYQNPDNNLFIFDPLTGTSISFKAKTGYPKTFHFNLLQQFNDSTLFLGSSKEPYFFTWSENRGLKKIKYPVQVAHWVTFSSHNSFWVLDSSNYFCEINIQGELLHKCRDTDDSLSLVPSMSTDSYALSTLMPGQHQTFKPLTDVAVYKNKASLYLSNSKMEKYAYKGSGEYDLNGIRLKELTARLDPMYFIYCTHIYIENDNEIWVASGFGLLHITVSKNKFRKHFFREEKDISNNSFRGLMVSNNILYAINEAKGIFQLNLTTGKSDIFTPFPDLNMQLFSITQNYDGRIFGLRGTQLYIHDKNWSTRDNHLKDENILPGTTWKISPITKDSFLTVGWQGLKYYNLPHHAVTLFKKYNSFNTLSTSLVIDIINDKDGYKWICSNSGLYLYDDIKGITARYSSADTGSYFLPALDIHHIFCDEEGIYWLGTANGLIRWDKAHNSYRLFTIADGLSNNNIYAVYGDNYHRLWMSSDYGLMQFDKKNGKVKNYLTGEGISYNEFNRLSHTRDSAGNLYFGTLNGVTAFNPADFPIDDSINAAPLEISSFEQFDGKTGKLENKTSSLLHTSSIMMEPGDRFFNLGLAMLTFNDAIHTTYYYKIGEIDTAWTSFKEPALHLSSLPYGTLTLLVKAQASDGSWAKNELRFNIYVIKPFYLQIWFFELLTILIISGLFFGYKWRIRRLKKENVYLDSIIREKTAALEETILQLELSSMQKDILMKEIHHRVKNNLQIIGTLLNLQLSRISDKQARQSLEESASRISSIALVHFQLYHKETLSRIELSNFTTELFQQISSIYKKEEQDVQLENNIEKTWLDIDTALPLGLILNELMTNSFKYAYNNKPNCSMKIIVRQKENTFTLWYSDFGQGLPENFNLKTSKSLGMTLIKSLTKQMAGNFTYNRTENCFLIQFIDTHTRKTIA